MVNVLTTGKLDGKKNRWRRRREDVASLAMWPGETSLLEIIGIAQDIMLYETQRRAVWDVRNVYIILLIFCNCQALLI